MTGFLQARRATILSAIAAMPPSVNLHRKRLAFVTSAFLDLPLFAEAVRHGWTDRELFAVDPVRCSMRPDRAGVVSGIALSSLAGPKLLRIEADVAVIESGAGDVRPLLRQPRVPIDYLGLVWWHSPELGGCLPETLSKDIAA